MDTAAINHAINASDAHILVIKIDTRQLTLNLN